jgi:hypothetical protein
MSEQDCLNQWERKQ